MDASTPRGPGTLLRTTYKAAFPETSTTPSNEVSPSVVGLWDAGKRSMYRR